MNATLRYQILRRDNFSCRYCGAKAPDVELHVDHVVPTALGGRDEPENLVSACAECNSGKAATPADAAVVADVAATALAAREALRLAAEEMSRQFDVDTARVIDFIAMWNDRITWCPISVEDRSSILRVLNSGLPAEEIVDAFHIAARSPMYVKSDQVWTYFHGIVNKKLERMHQIAKRIREESE